MEWEGQNYLITVDGYSDNFDISKRGHSPSTARIVKASKKLFGFFGRPTKLRTDSDPRYLSAEFRSFCKDWEIQH